MTIRIEKSDGVWTIIHSDPDTRNAMDPAAAQDLHDAFSVFDSDETAAVAVLWGEGGTFCSGWNLNLASELSGTETLGEHDPDRPGARGPMGPTRLQLGKPVIAAIAGPAVAGGMEIAMWCDIRVMESSAYFGVFNRRWGVPLIDGGTVRLPRLVGLGRAMDILLTGRRVDAHEALRIGLCEYVVVEGEARARAEEIAAEIARFPQMCLRSDRQSLLRQQGLSEQAAIAQEWHIGIASLAAEGIDGARRFAEGAGRHGKVE